MLTHKKVPSASLVKMTLWTFVEAQITNIEMKHDALLKIVVDKHSQFGPIWQIFLPLYHQPSKRASCFISILGNLASTKVHKAIFTSELLGTFICIQKKYRSFFSLGQSLAIGLLTHISRYGIFKCIFKNIFTI